MKCVYGEVKSNTGKLIKEKHEKTANIETQLIRKCSNDKGKLAQQIHKFPGRPVRRRRNKCGN